MLDHDRFRDCGICGDGNVHRSLMAGVVFSEDVGGCDRLISLSVKGDEGLIARHFTGTGLNLERSEVQIGDAAVTPDFSVGSWEF